MSEQDLKVKLFNSGALSTLTDQPLDQDLADQVNKKSKRAKIREELLPFRLLPNVSSIRVVTSPRRCENLYDSYKNLQTPGTP